MIPRKIWFPEWNSPIIERENDSSIIISAVQLEQMRQQIFIYRQLIMPQSTENVTSTTSVRLIQRKDCTFIHQSIDENNFPSKIQHSIDNSSNLTNKSRNKYQIDDDQKQELDNFPSYDIEINELKNHQAIFESLNSPQNGIDFSTSNKTHHSTYWGLQRHLRNPIIVQIMEFKSVRKKRELSTLLSFIYSSLSTNLAYHQENGFHNASYTVHTPLSISYQKKYPKHTFGKQHILGSPPGSFCNA
jgi:hypothetical protein